jgi:exosortase A-associated hydrolase 2
MLSAGAAPAPAASASATTRNLPSGVEMAGEHAFFFTNSVGLRLYGVVHAAAARPAGDIGIVFCDPLSEEKDHCQRPLVDLARLLAREGYPTLRFDAAGCGDSEGELVTATLQSLLQDVRAAVTELLRRSDVRRIVLIGVRLGALLAQLAAEADPRICGLVLVAPVVSGRDYWNGLLRSQQMACLTRGIKAPRLEESRRILAESGRLEIKGEYFGRDLVEELAIIDLRTRPTPFRGPQLIVGSVDEPPNAGTTESLVAAARTAGSEVTSPGERVGVFWSSKALYAGYRPSSLYDATLAWCRGIPP